MCEFVVLCADSRFAKPRSSLRGRTDLFFSLVRKEPKVPQRFANLWTPGTIQSSAGNNFGEASGDTSRNRFFAQDGGEKALNRCEVRALQRKDLERTAKEQPCSLQTVGYGWVRICGVGCENLRRLRTEKKGLCKRKALGLCKMVQVHLERFSTNENVFSLRKRRIFQLMQDNIKMKSFL